MISSLRSVAPPSSSPERRTPSPAGRREGEVRRSIAGNEGENLLTPLSTRDSLRRQQSGVVLEQRDERRSSHRERKPGESEGRHAAGREPQPVGPRELELPRARIPQGG
jgi:hypothetical protein